MLFFCLFVLVCWPLASYCLVARRMFFAHLTCTILSTCLVVCWMPAGLPTCLSAWMLVQLYVCLFPYLSTPCLLAYSSVSHLSVYLLICLFLIYLSTCLFVCLSSLCLLAYLSVSFLSVYLLICVGRAFVYSPVCVFNASLSTWAFLFNDMSVLFFEYRSPTCLLQFVYLFICLLNVCLSTHRFICWMPSSSMCLYVYEILTLDHATDPSYYCMKRQ